MRHEERTQVATHQRRRFNELVDAFDTPQPQEVMGRLEQIVAAARLRPGEAVLDVGTGVGVLIPLIKPYRAAVISACDLAERMLRRVREKHPDVRTYRADIALLKLDPASVDVIFMNAMYGNIADKPRACRNAARMLRPGGRLVVSHPEGRAFVDQLRMTSDLFIESLPSREEFQALLQPLGLEVLTYRDEPKLYLMVAQKRESGQLQSPTWKIVMAGMQCGPWKLHGPRNTKRQGGPETRSGWHRLSNGQQHQEDFAPPFPSQGIR